jgi:hypothetical protein
MTSNGITADTGFLVALERHKQRATDLAGFASARKLLISAPVVVIAEWWRGGPGQSRILKFVRGEEMTERLARSAGEALAAVPGATVVDAT